jgi:hypothetical protein
MALEKKKPNSISAGFVSLVVIAGPDNYRENQRHGPGKEKTQRYFRWVSEPGGDSRN